MIKCNEYDAIEIVCMYRYPLKIIMKTGDIINCTAIDTCPNDDRDECIKVSLTKNSENKSNANKVILIVLTKISALKVMVENPHLQQITFQ